MSLFDLTLTFDNGPDLGVTPQVLDVLAQRKLRATFFVIGEKVAQPALRKLAERAHAEGHWIGNHTWTHSVPLGDSSGPDLAESEVGQTERAIAGLTHPSRFFRPFGGGGNLNRSLLSQPVVDYLQQGQFTCVLWNAIPRDWCDPDGWVERALHLCESQPWSLLVLHDLPTGAMRHLPRFLDQVAARGGRLHQEFPQECVPIVRGEIVRPIGDYMMIRRTNDDNFPLARDGNHLNRATG